MFSSPTPAPGSRTLASNALRGAGLMERDATMRDVSDKPTGRKPATKHRPHRARAIYDVPMSDKGSGSSTRMLSSRIAVDGNSDLLSIRGAGRPINGTRPRRNAVSGGVQVGLVTPARGSSVMSRIPKHRGGAVEQWTEFVNKRYDPQTKRLNLDSMAEDELLRKHSLVAPGQAGGSAREAGVIFKLASKLQPPVETVSLANNGLNGQHLTYLDKYLPRIANLSLQNNNMRMWKDLDPISSRRGKLPNLRELVLIGNPLRELQNAHGNLDRYKREAARRFITLELLDQDPIAKISFDVATSDTPASSVKPPDATTFPYPMGPSFIDGVDPTLVSTFLSRFFPAFDEQRPSLVNVYSPASTFSFHANTGIPQRARVQGVHTGLPNQRKLDWRAWIDHGSRNLHRLSGDKTIAALHIGGQDIIQALIKLPLTKHDIGSEANFCVDAFLAGVGLLVIVHGQFIEAPSQGMRSFDRTFMLAPAPENSTAKQNGWDVVILSDQWTIRGLSKPEAWAPGPMLVQATLDSNPLPTQRHLHNLPADQQALLNTVPEPQRPIVLNVCAQTGLNVQFALDCLNSNAWDVGNAVANFNRVKSSLAPEAFLLRQQQPQQ
ncbi:hypothetical protein R3P38DRAFT_2700120 [Favolaschia claudopus]|uniref:NTF2-like protein n=1 Tax=Favolaschia claudopus TaxID=2862362 RepID=A0AAW0C133_9AGAR